MRHEFENTVGKLDSGLCRGGHSAATAFADNQTPT